MAKMPSKMMKAFEKKDEAMDKKKGIKEMSKADMKKDAKAGFPYPKAKGKK
jgi:hypothetical protein